MAQVIQRSNTSPWGQALGVLGQGAAGFANGALLGQQMNLAKQNSANTSALMARLFGANGTGIQPPAGGIGQQAAATPSGTAQPTNILPSTPANAGGSGANGGTLNMDDLLAQIYRTPSQYGV